MSTIGIDFGTSNTRLVIQERNRPQSAVILPDPALTSQAYQQDRRWVQGHPLTGASSAIRPKGPLSQEALAPDHWVKTVSPQISIATVSGELLPQIDQMAQWTVGSGDGPDLAAARQAATAILQKLRDEFHAVTGRDPEARDAFVLGCPAAQTLGIYRMTLIAVAQAAGWPLTPDNTYVLSEPVGVALNVMPERPQPTATVAIVDVGGGTTDIAVVEVTKEDGQFTAYRVQFSDQLPVAGQSVDGRLIQFWPGAHVPPELVERQKVSCSLGSDDVTFGPHGRYTLTRAMLTQAVRETIVNSIVTNPTLMAKLRGAERVVLAGGAAPSPGLREALAEHTGRPVTVIEQAGFATARGFARLLDDHVALQQGPSADVGYWDVASRRIETLASAFEPLPAIHEGLSSKTVTVPADVLAVALFQRSPGGWHPAGVLTVDGARRVTPHWDPHHRLAFDAPSTRSSHEPTRLTWQPTEAVPHLRTGLPVRYGRNTLKQYSEGQGLIANITPTDGTPLSDWVGDMMAVTVTVTADGHSSALVKTPNAHWSTWAMPPHGGPKSWRVATARPLPAPRRDLLPGSAVVPRRMQARPGPSTGQRAVGLITELTALRAALTTAEARWARRRSP